MEVSLRRSRSRFQVALRLFLCSALGTLFLLLLLLLGLHCGEVNVPDEDAFEDKDQEHDDEDGEQVWLVVKGSNGLRRGADLAEPIELTHGRSLLLDCWKGMTETTVSVWLALQVDDGFLASWENLNVYKQLDQQMTKEAIRRSE